MTAVGVAAAVLLLSVLESTIALAMEIARHLTCAVVTVVIPVKTALFQTVALSLTTVHPTASVCLTTEKRRAGVSRGTVDATAASLYAPAGTDVRATANALR